MPRTRRKKGAGSSSAVVLLSAGLDSSFNLAMACAKFDVRLALTFNYGQKAARQEIDHATRLAEHYRVPHHVLFLPWFKDFTKTALLGGGKIPTGSRVGIDNIKKSRATAKRVWVPNRNGILLNIAAGFAEGLGAKYVIPGFNLEEGATFPDNTEEFLGTLDAAWSYSTASEVKSFCFSTKLTKTEIVKRGIELDLPFEMLWPCYFAKTKWCGACESCQRYQRALGANGLSFEELRSAI